MPNDNTAVQEEAIPPAENKRFIRYLPYDTPQHAAWLDTSTNCLWMDKPDVDPNVTHSGKD